MLDGEDNGSCSGSNDQEGFIHDRDQDMSRLLGSEDRSELKDGRRRAYISPASANDAELSWPKQCIALRPTKGDDQSNTNNIKGFLRGC